MSFGDYTEWLGDPEAGVNLPLLAASYEIAGLEARIAEVEAENLQLQRYADNVEALTNRIIAARDARIAELDTELALLRRALPATSVLNPGGTFADEPEPPPANPPPTDAQTGKVATPRHNPFRDFPTDPRRMGP
jgi:hypothetical protein